jgi:hypothetical protein
MKAAPLDRRTFLARLGVLGAVAGTGLLLPGAANAAAATPALSAGAVADLVRQIIDALTKDTLNAVAAFVVPGQDPYSTAQGTPRSEPGALAARTPDYLVSFFDNYVALPQDLVRGVSAALADGLADVPVQLPGGTPVVVPGVLEALDDAVRLQLRGPDALPLAEIIALLLNVVATQVDPASVHGAFLSPFARLSFARKAAVFSVLEAEDSALVTAIEGGLGALAGTISGLVRFLTGALLELTAFGTYSEWSTFDPATMSVRRRPVGWDISRFDPGVLNGWDDFKGYYQGRSEVDA